MMRVSSMLRSAAIVTNPAQACRTLATGALWGMHQGRPFQPRDSKLMFAVRYEDGQTAYIRVSPEAARYGNMVVMSIAREYQKAGDIPDGTIISVKQAH